MERFVPNSQWPQLSEAVTVCRDEKRGRYVKALRDINMGEIVCFEDGIVASIDSQVCVLCLQPEKSFVCSSCEKVYNEKFKDVEGTFGEELNELGLVKLFLRILLSYELEDMKTAVNEGDHSTDDFSTSQFRSIMALQKGESIDLSVVGHALARIATTLTKFKPEWKNQEKLFSRLEDELFPRMITNAHTIYPLVRNATSEEDALPAGTGLFPVCSIMNHSCKANVFSYFVGNKFVFVSKGVKRGEELVDNYGTQWNTRDYQHRKEFLLGRGFECQCAVCEKRSENDDYLLTGMFEIEDEVPDLPSYKQARQRFPLGHLRWENVQLSFIKRADIDSHDKLSLFHDLLQDLKIRKIFVEPEQIIIYLRMVAVVEYEKADWKDVETWLICALLRMRCFCWDHPLKDEVLSLLKEISSDSRLPSKKSFKAFKQLMTDVSPGYCF